MEYSQKVIKEFRGDFEYMSNFYRRAPFVDKCNAKWKTVEHYFQAAKTTHPGEKFDIWMAQEPGIAKKLGTRCSLVPNWRTIKESVMKDAITMKFRQNLDIAKKLVSTHGFRLIEGNTWHDNFWGVCRCKKCEDQFGINRLGDILETVRNDIMRDQDFMLKIVKEG
jgi:ribA/ribD-fused uncharacterized protein